MTSELSPKHRTGPVYRAYLIRIWQEHPEAPPRASAKPVGGENTVRFATLEALFAYLAEKSAPGHGTIESIADAGCSEDEQ